jgi:hypothetical protein
LPQLAASIGANWDEHRAIVQQMCIDYSVKAVGRLGIVTGSATDFVEFVDDAGFDPLDEQARGAYTKEQNLDAGVVWPPRRNKPCWCGLEIKYKQCCLRRAPQGYFVGGVPDDQ